MSSTVYRNFTQKMMAYFPNGIGQNGADLSRLLDDRLRDFGEGTLGEAYIWFIDNRQSQTFPPISECLSRCRTIKDRNSSRAATERINAERQLEKQEEKAFTQTPREREYVQGGMVLLAQLSASKTNEQRQAINNKIEARKREFSQQGAAK